MIMDALGWMSAADDEDQQFMLGRSHFWIVAYTSRVDCIKVRLQW
jgi:hypothetical protein